MDCEHCGKEMECVEDNVRGSFRKPYGIGDRFYECQNDECPYFLDEDNDGRYTETETEDDRAADYADSMYDASRDA